MSYAKAMKHWKNPRKGKLTKAKIRGNLLVWLDPKEDEERAKELYKMSKNI